MSRGAKVAIGGIAIAIILWIVGIPWWAPVLVILAALAIPVAGYLMLDPSQRRRVRNISRKRIGS
jgi:cell division protein FtsW (lipid II flippase)